MQEIRGILDALSSTEVAYFEDEIDIHLNLKIGRDWMLRGQQRRILTPGQNKKRYLAGALSTDGTSLVTVKAERKTTDLFLALLEKLRRRHRSATRIHVILDNYVIHSSRKAKAYLESNDTLFARHSLPPHCPDENRIERLWGGPARRRHAQPPVLLHGSTDGRGPLVARQRGSPPSCATPSRHQASQATRRMTTMQSRGGRLRSSKPPPPGAHHPLPPPKRRLALISDLGGEIERSWLGLGRSGRDERGRSHLPGGFT